MTLENAINSALEKNFDVQKMNNNILVSKNNTSIFNSGYLPTLTSSASGKYNNTNTVTVLLDDNEREFIGAGSLIYSGNVSLNYDLFTGFYRKNQSSKLKQLYKVASIQKKELINNLLFDIHNSYYSIVKAELQKDVLEQIYIISIQRLTRIKYKYDFGQISKLELLKAKVDANNDSLKIANAEVNIANLKRNLNYLIGNKISNEFEIERKVVVNNDLVLNDISKAVFKNNFLLKQVELNKMISETDLKISKAGYYPRFTASAGYSLNNSIYDASLFFKEQNVNGVNVGLNLSWNIFDGGATKVKVQNTKINRLNQDLNLEQIKLNLQNQLSNTWANYQYALASISSEKFNVELSQENFKRTKERFNLGQISSIDFRQAQLNLINSKINLIQAQFNAKLNEILLKKLSRGLVE